MQNLAAFIFRTIIKFCIASSMKISVDVVRVFRFFSLKVFSNFSEFLFFFFFFEESYNIREILRFLREVYSTDIQRISNPQLTTVTTVTTWTMKIRVFLDHFAIRMVTLRSTWMT